MINNMSCAIYSLVWGRLVGVLWGGLHFFLAGVKYFSYFRKIEFDGLFP